MRVNTLANTSEKRPVLVFLVTMALLPLTSGCQDTEVIESSNAETTTSIVAAAPKADPVAAAGTADTPYDVVCSKDETSGQSKCVVDKATFIGWRTFHGFCHVCHAQDAVGSTFAPSLLDRMQEMDYELFVERTNNGYTGQVGVMPPWKDNPNVSKRYKELFAYLKARSDGVLLRGRPAKKPK